MFQYYLKGKKSNSGLLISLIIVFILQTGALFSAPRQVKIGALFMGGTHSFSLPLETKINNVAPLLAEARNQNIDIVLLAETYFQGNTIASDAQKFADSIVLDSMKVFAKKYNINIIFQVYELETGPTKLYNTAVLIDRDGEFVGKYRKVNLAPGIEKNLLTPGESYPVFETDFGKVGILICWDGWFTNPAKILVDKGAEVLFIPTSENNVLNLKTITAENGVPVCYSVDHVNDIPSSVYDFHGDSVFYNVQVGLDKIAVGTVTIGQYKNLALNKSVFASDGTDPESPAVNAVDGLYSTERDTPPDSQTSWKAKSLPQWIEIDLGHDYEIDRVSIAQFDTDDYLYQIEGKLSNGIYELLSDSVTKFESHVEWDIAGSEILSSRFEKKKVRFVKLTINSATKTDLTINEIKVFGYFDDQTGIRENTHKTGFTNYELFQNHPNPFNSTTAIQFVVSKVSHVKLDVLNIKGQKIVTLIDRQYTAGNHTALWNGIDQNNHRVTSGVYFYRLHTDGQVLTKKMLLLE